MAKKKTAGIHPHIRITDADEIKLLDNLKKETHEKTYSGALMHSAHDYFHFQTKLKESAELISKLQRQLRSAHDVIESTTRAKVLSESYTKQYKIVPGRHAQASLYDDDLD